MPGRPGPITPSRWRSRYRAKKNAAEPTVSFEEHTIPGFPIPVRVRVIARRCELIPPLDISTGRRARKSIGQFLEGSRQHLPNGTPSGTGTLPVDGISSGEIRSHPCGTTRTLARVSTWTIVISQRVNPTSTFLQHHLSTDKQTSVFCRLLWKVWRCRLCHIHGIC